MERDPLGHDVTTLPTMPGEDQTAPDPDNERAADEESFIAAYDLDGDGEVSAVEDVRGKLGLADARLEQIAEEGGAKGKIADAVHHIVDKFDND